MRRLLSLALLTALTLTAFGSLCDARDQYRPSDIIDLSLTKDGRLIGWCQTADGNETSRVPVGLFRQKKLVARTKSAVDGSFSLPDIPIGFYELRSTHWNRPVRIWGADTAPPAAKDPIVIIIAAASVESTETAPTSAMPKPLHEPLTLIAVPALLKKNDSPPDPEPVFLDLNETTTSRPFLSATDEEEAPLRLIGHQTEGNRVDRPTATTTRKSYPALRRMLTPTASFDDRGPASPVMPTSLDRSHSSDRFSSSDNTQRVSPITPVTVPESPFPTTVTPPERVIEKPVIEEPLIEKLVISSPSKPSAHPQLTIMEPVAVVLAPPVTDDTPVAEDTPFNPFIVPPLPAHQYEQTSSEIATPDAPAFIAGDSLPPQFPIDSAPAPAPSSAETVEAPLVDSSQLVEGDDCCLAGCDASCEYEGVACRRGADGCYRYGYGPTVGQVITYGGLIAGAVAIGFAIEEEFEDERVRRPTSP